MIINIFNLIGIEDIHVEDPIESKNIPEHIRFLFIRFMFFTYILRTRRREKVIFYLIFLNHFGIISIQLEMKVSLKT